MEQQISLSVTEQIFGRLSLETPWLEKYRLSEYPRRRTPEYVFRAAGPTSSGINHRTGIKAGLYLDLAMEEIPSFAEIGTPGTHKTYSRKLLEDETLSHLKKYERMPTGWISTTSSLPRALDILFIEHREHGQLFVLRIAACKDIVSVPALRDCLPGLENNRYLRLKSPNEFLIRGKVEERAIVGCATVQSLHSHNLDIIAPGLRTLTSWKEQQDWTRELAKSYPSHREISCELLDRAVALVLAFDMEDKAVSVKRFLDLEFRIDSEGLDDWVVLDRIGIGEILRGLGRAFEKHAQARDAATQAIERYTGRVGQFADGYNDFGLDDFVLLARARKLEVAEERARERRARKGE